MPTSEPAILLHPYGQMRRLRDGQLILNARGFYSPQAYAENPDLPTRMTYFYRSDDGGQSWGDPQLVKAGMTETAFLPLDEDNWLAFVRNPQGPSQIARSDDGGESWRGWAPALGGREGASPFRHPGSIARLRNGNIIITYGHRQNPLGVRAIVSRDGGRSFDTEREYTSSPTATCTRTAAIRAPSAWRTAPSSPSPTPSSTSITRTGAPAASPTATRRSSSTYESTSIRTIVSLAVLLESGSRHWGRKLWRGHDGDATGHYGSRESSHSIDSSTMPSRSNRAYIVSNSLPPSSSQ